MGSNRAPLLVGVPQRDIDWAARHVKAGWFPLAAILDGLNCRLAWRGIDAVSTASFNRFCLRLAPPGRRIVLVARKA